MTTNVKCPLKITNVGIQVTIFMLEATNLIFLWMVNEKKKKTRWLSEDGEKKKTKKVDDFNYDSSMLFSLLIQQQVVFWWKRNPRILKKKKKKKSDKHTTESYAVKGAGTALRRLKKNIIPHLRYSSHSVELKHRLLTTSPNNPLFFLCSFILKV